jgi:hypothetical protein
MPNSKIAKIIIKGQKVHWWGKKKDDNYYIIKK